MQVKMYLLHVVFMTIIIVANNLADFVDCLFNLIKYMLLDDHDCNLRFNVF